jgi:hypothetical protein
MAIIIECPSCGSNDVAKSAAIYEQGTSKSKGKTVGVGISRDGAGIGVASSAGVTKSLAAQKNAPPNPNPLPGCAGVLTFVIAVNVLIFSDVGFFTSTFVSLGVAIVAGTLTYRKTRQQDNEVQSRYEKTWYCTRCSQIFIP